MEKFSGEGIFVRYRTVQGHRVLSGCLYCHGALLWGYKPLGPDRISVYKCIHCGRMFERINENGWIRLFPYKEYEHLPSLNKAEENKTQNVPPKSNTNLKRLKEKNFIGILKKRKR